MIQMKHLKNSLHLMRRDVTCQSQIKAKMDPATPAESTLISQSSMGLEPVNQQTP